ncbi:MAG: hypothetical protein AB7F20_03415 [Geoalkalibacter sp.]
MALSQEIIRIHLPAALVVGAGATRFFLCRNRALASGEPRRR